jgi:biotin carboxyl carrier protein
MKLYTTISATGPGRVVEICAENGAMVDANEILFRIEPL